MDSGIFRVRTRVLYWQNLNVPRNILCSHVSVSWCSENVQVCFVPFLKKYWFLFLMSLLLNSIVPCSRYLQLCNKQAWVHLGLWEHQLPNVFYQNQVLTCINKGGSHILPFYTWSLPCHAAIPCPHCPPLSFLVCKVGRCLYGLQYLKR